VAQNLDRVVDFAPSETIADYILDDSFVCGIRGPVGSGKTSGSIFKAFRKMEEQEPDEHGWRKSKGVIIRRTGPQLKTTTLATWREWAGGDDLGDYAWSAPMTQMLRYQLPDKTKVECEVLFLPLDGNDDIGKVKSLEISWAFVNEMSEFDWEVLLELIKRLGRYPKKRQRKDGTFLQCTKPQLFFDTNAPPMESMLYRQFEEIKPAGWIMYTQPPAAFEDPNGVFISAEGTRYRINENCDNYKWLPDDYYSRSISGISDRSIKVYVLNKYGSLLSGRPVYTTYNDDVHFSKVPLIVYNGLPLNMTLDFGGTTTALLSQFSARGQLRCLEELCTELNLQPFINQVLVPKLRHDYPGLKVEDIIGDPAGVATNASGLSMYDELGRAGFPSRPVDLHGTKDDPEIEQRKLAVDDLLGRMVQGEPCLLIGPKCPMLRSGFLGKYRYVQLSNRSADVVFRPTPLKNEVSHIHDCLQYRCVHIKGPRSKKGVNISGVVNRQREAAAARKRIGG
jgi:hypothetical protein